MFCGNRVSIGHIGDSRCYRLRGEKFEQLTRDHSLLQEQIDGGQLTPEQARFSLNKNLVTRALGIEAIVPPDIVEYRAEAEDIYLLNSDGLTDMVEPAVVHSIIEQAARQSGRGGQGARRHRQSERRARQHFGRAGPRAEGIPAERRVGAALSREEARGLGPSWGSCALPGRRHGDRNQLDRQRITIGRRPDNDICLAYPAVSGEHAAVVTILADSFLEDLGSTNGTLVNGAAVAKHFLRDRDEIDIGQQMLVYLVDDAATLEAPPQSVAGAGGRRRRAAVRTAPRHCRLPARAATRARSAPSADRMASRREPCTADRSHRAVLRRRFERGWPTLGSRRPRRRRSPAMSPRRRPPPPERRPEPASALKVVSGAKAGRIVALVKDETLIGRAGVQVAALRRTADEVRVVPIEGASPPCVNGMPVAPEGQPLAVGDILEIAGTRLEVVAPRRAHRPDVLLDDRASRAYDRWHGSIGGARAVRAQTPARTT